jgi:hypothetical protein
LESCGRFCVGAFSINLTSVAVNVFTFKLLYEEIVYIYFFTLNAICKDNAATVALLFSIKRMYRIYQLNGICNQTLYGDC